MRAHDHLRCYEIEDGEVERLGLTPTGEFDVVQHIELPESPVHVTEYRLAVYQDADGQLHIPDSPKFKGPIFGPRLLGGEFSTVNMKW